MNAEMFKVNIRIKGAVEPKWLALRFDLRLWFNPDRGDAHPS